MELRRENEICEFPLLSGGYPITSLTNIFLPGVLSVTPSRWSVTGVEIWLTAMPRNFFFLIFRHYVLSTFSF